MTSQWKRLGTRPSSSARSLLLVAPTKRELAGIKSTAPYISTGVVGLGNSAGPALSNLIHESHPDLIISIGFAGALQSNINCGDIIICRSVQSGNDHISPIIGLDGSSIKFVTSLLGGFGIAVTVGELITASKSLTKGREKRDCGTQTGAAAVDMEGYSLAIAANQAKSPIVMIRSILDPVSYELPGLVTTIIADQGKHEWLHTARALSSDPRIILDLMRLARKARRSAHSLSICGKIIMGSFLGD
jgi:adenosylhomocysteine nucleosidase